MLYKYWFKKYFYKYFIKNDKAIYFVDSFLYFS